MSGQKINFLLSLLAEWTHFCLKFVRYALALRGDSVGIGAAVRLRIIMICRQRSITVNKLSTLCGVTQSTLNNIVSGRNNSATISTIKKICDGLEISIIDFFDDDLFRDLEQEICWTVYIECSFTGFLIRSSIKFQAFPFSFQIKTGLNLPE